MWVRGHTGVIGNEEADRRAALEVYQERTGAYPGLVTPAGNTPYTTNLNTSHGAGGVSRASPT